MYFIFVLAILASPLFAQLPNSGSELPSLAIDAKPTSDGGEIALLWFLTNPFCPGLNTHTKISLNGRVIDTFCVLEPAKTEGVQERFARRFSKGVHLRLSMPISREDLFKVQERIQSGGDDLPIVTTCALGACDLMDAAGVVKVPPPFSSIPSATVAYVIAVKLFGGRGDISIRFVGSKLDLIPMSLLLPSGLLGDLALGTTASVLANFEIVLRNITSTAYGGIKSLFSRAVLSCNDLLGKKAE